ncbi:MAG: CotH kinase family protein [Bacteroidaceae bacterium]|nr:CotH kinase family protein [Bacteroidaceae bacterium]
MLELDSYFDEDFKFKSGIYDLPVNVKDPDLFDYDEAEREAKFSAIQADFAKFEEVLYNNGPLGQYLDLDAAARFLFVNELVLNKELCHPKSTYLWKGDMYSPDSKIVFGPLWDFDWAFGYENTGRYFEIGYTTSLLSMGTIGRNFFEALMDNEEFRRHYYKVWKDFVDNGYIEEIMEYISDYYSFAESSFKNNNDRWGDGSEYGSKIKTMQNWLKKRHDYIFANIKEYDIKDILHTLVGDIDCNDLLTIQDVALFADYLLGKADEKFNIAKADIDADGKIGYSDFVRSAVLLACGESLPPMYFFEKPVSATALVSVDQTVASENVINIPIHLQSNKEGIKAIQADIAVPSNVVIENIFTENGATGDSVVYTKITDGLYRVVVYNKNGTPFVCDKPVMNFEILIPDSATAEPPVVKIKDILVVDSANLEKRTDDVMFAVKDSGGSTAVDIVNADAAVKVNGNSIALTNADNCSVVIYSAAGSVVERIDNYSGEEITLPDGIYIVRAGSRVVKIKL